MGATDAERARRYRAHRRGDHAHCLPERCDAAPRRSEAVTPPVTVTPVTRTRDVTGGFGRRGAQLWSELTEAGTPTGARRVLAEEACRLADRLEQLDEFLTGRADAWLDLSGGDDGRVVVVVDKALSEARQQQLALKAIVAELRQGQGDEAPQTGGGILDQLAARRAARVAGAAGRSVPAVPADGR